MPPACLNTWGLAETFQGGPDIDTSVTRRGFLRTAAATVGGLALARMGFRPSVAQAAPSLYVGPGQRVVLRGLNEFTGNVVVDGGQLLLRRDQAGNSPILRFVGVDETAYVGGGDAILDSDVGLWVTNGGFLDARNSTIEGTPGGKAHVIFLGAVALPILNGLTLRHLGPQDLSDPRGPKTVLGRWPFHFHKSGESVRGLIVEDILAEDCGSHAFVVHLTNGVTLRRSTARRVFGDPYWWDVDTASHDVIYEDCLAEDVYETIDEGRDVAGFYIGEGTGNKLIRCTARRAPIGATWDVKNQDGLWVTEDFVAEDCSKDGIFWWQNNTPAGMHDTFRFRSVRNNRAMLQGAYTSRVVHYDLVADTEVEYHALAVSRADGVIPGLYRPVIASTGDYAMRLTGGILDGFTTKDNLPWRFQDASLSGLVNKVIIDRLYLPRKWDFVATLATNNLEPEHVSQGVINADFILRSQRADGTAWQMTSAGVTVIPAFA